MHENKVDNQITKKLWIIKTFWNIYLQDNYHFKDLNIKKKWLIFKIQIKNASKLAKKSSKNESKLEQNSIAGLAPKRAIQHSWSANWPKFVARPKDSLIEIMSIFFSFLELRMHSNSYMILFNIPTTINRENKSELRALLFWLFNSPYIKDVLKAFTLGTYFL